MPTKWYRLRYWLIARLAQRDAMLINVNINLPPDLIGKKYVVYHGSKHTLYVNGNISASPEGWAKAKGIIEDLYPDD
jgi:hypothetical protein